MSYDVCTEINFPGQAVTRVNATIGQTQALAALCRQYTEILRSFATQHIQRGGANANMFATERHSTLIVQIFHGTANGEAHINAAERQPCS